MATVASPIPVTLFLGIMYHDPILRDQALAQFSDRFGSVKEQIGPFCFSDHSNYYDREIGGTVFKSYYLFETPIDRDSLASIKRFTNSIESAFTDEISRPVNLDPGYLAADKFVLASAKDFAHRISIGQGIYAEVTLHFHQNRVKFFSWSYEDYRRPEVQDFLNRGRPNR